MIIQGQKKQYQVVIGLEVHAQIRSASKLFSKAQNANEITKPNSTVNNFDIAIPGTLPLLNIYAMKQAITAGLAVNGNINLYSRFDRKGYFYPDLPSGYQITQFYYPIVSGGYIDLPEHNHRVEIDRIHVEQDAGKLIHDLSIEKSYIDFNRAGIPLMEIVSKPQIRNGEEAVSYLKTLRHILRHVGASECDMEKGSFRCDVNISVMEVGTNIMGTRCEIKNVNSFKSVAKAIEYESVRQVDVIENGGIIMQETRSFNQDTLTTHTMRLKTDAGEYSYFPDPDLLPFIVTEQFVDDIRNQMPELPSMKIARYINEYKLSNDDAVFLVNEREYGDYFDYMVSQKKYDPRLCLTWIVVELCGRLKKIKLTPNSSNISKDDMAALLHMINNNTISGKIAKTVLDDMIAGKGSPMSIVKSRGLEQLNDAETLQIIDNVIKNHASLVQEYKDGKTSIFGFIVGEIMKQTSGKANPAFVNTTLRKKLDTQ